MSTRIGVPPSRPIYVIAPFFRKPELVESFFDSLEPCVDELKELQCTIVAINDSPEDLELAEALREASRGRLCDVPFLLRENAMNVGFVKSVNRGLKEAVEAGADVILLNSDTVVYPGAIREIQRVAYLDPMIGFVSPRTNHATICSFPHQEEFRKLQPDDSYSIFQELSTHLPEFHYVPTAVGFCMFIKLDILREFGLLDEKYGKGYNEENDLVMRANRCGFRAALANHAFVYHIGESSFSVSDLPKSTHDERNAALLKSRYPEYMEHVHGYLESAHYKGEVLLRGLLKDNRGRYDIVFDFSSFGDHHNGTFEAAKQILIHAAKSWQDIFNIHVMAGDLAIRFHDLHEIQGIFFVPNDTTRVFAIAFRFGQPFVFDVIARMSSLAVFNVYSMLDPIAWDCLYLNRDNLDEMWKAVFLHADATMYISDFVAEQFHLRFPVRPGMKELVSYLSLDTQDYKESLNGSPVRGNYLLVIGNSFAHKNVRPTVDALSKEFPREKIVALGVEQTGAQNVIGYASGRLSEEELEGMFLNASAVIFPSFYEGFGIPIIRSLSCHKPLLARSIPVNQDLYEKLGRPEDFILYNSTDDLIERLKQGIPEWKNSVQSTRNKYDWATSTKEMGEFLRALPETVSFSDVLLPRLNYTALLRKAFLREAACPEQPVLGSFGDNSEFYEEGVLLESYETRIRQRDQRIGKLKEEIEELEDLVVQRDRRIAQAQMQSAELETALRERDNRILGLRTSVSWLITAPLRGIGNLGIKLLGGKSASDRHT
jgi:GT2 family glycosyltransferase/glycosyltransferase involved in cell wall biosynthesis